ncbi:hypothetical protein B5M42_014285 [Paenibacillus athensensis]|uniref:Uncharacterized protein n=1 Tax=Paenibacillus athensensis TaxID=1967502 RepID=A0A4Y8Q8N3_9BACL|nr:hypothetical protein [Paenibacillus athensensis]MCD1259982.1 hypothetical protein [Paenibacillus athensensis]
MKLYLHQGYRKALQQPFVCIILFLYQLGWGTLLYKLVQSVVVPLMHRYPQHGEPRQAVQLFLAESQFQLFKTDLSHPYLWGLALLLLIRMLLTPALNAGVYYSLAHPELHAGYRFVKGIRSLTLPFLFYYALRLALTALPLIWLGPKAIRLLAHSLTYEAALRELLPWFIGLLVYGYALHLVFMYLQFAKARRTGALSTLLIFTLNGLPIILLAVILLAAGALLAGVAATATYIWAGLLALILYQLMPLLHTFLQVWSIAAQYQLWIAKNSG